jgi:hypothetical protein
MKHRSLLVLMLLLLPLIGGYVVARHNAAADREKIQERTLVAISDEKRDQSIFAKAESALRKIRRTKKSMSNALAEYYQTILYTSSTYGTYPAVSTYSQPAPYVYDGNLSTYYKETAPSTSDYAGVLILIDLGPTPPAISKWSVSYGGGQGGGNDATDCTISLLTSSDGVTFSGVPSTGFADQAGGTYTQSFTAETKRYWLIAGVNVETFDANGYVQIEEAYLYDTSGDVIGPPATAPTVTLVPTQTFDRMKNPIDALAWTSTNATSVSISASAGTSPGSVTPVAGGTVAIATPTVLTTYTATATGPGGTATASTDYPGDTSVATVPMSVNGVGCIDIQGA